MARAKQLAQASGRFMRGSSLIDVQAGSFRSSKYKLFICLDKNSKNEIIQSVSDEGKGGNANSATFCACAWSWKTRLKKMLGVKTKPSSLEAKVNLKR
jgi:hypothetical protein